MLLEKFDDILIILLASFFALLKSYGCCLGFAPSQDHRSANWVEKNACEKGGKENLVGHSPLFVLGNLEGEKETF